MTVDSFRGLAKCIHLDNMEILAAPDETAHPLRRGQCQRGQTGNSLNA